VRLLLMTATPYTSEPMDLIKLLNLLRPRDDGIPESFDDFAEMYLNERGEFNRKKKLQFMNKITGYISYLNREKDVRQFAYPVFTNIKVPLSEDSSQNLEDAVTEAINEKDEKIRYIQELKETLKNRLADECHGAKPKRPCIERVKQRFAEEEGSVINDTANEVKDLKQHIRNLKKEFKNATKSDKSQESVLAEKCKLR